jgi:hypothetical protein
VCNGVNQVLGATDDAECKATEPDASRQLQGKVEVAVLAENRDRSSMADFVRILQAYDQDWHRRS